LAKKYLFQIQLREKVYFSESERDIFIAYCYETIIF